MVKPDGFKVPTCTFDENGIYKGVQIPFSTLGAVMSRVCQLTNKRRNVANKVSHSNIKTKKTQNVNIQRKRVWYAEENRYVQLRLSTSAIRTLKKKGLVQFAKETGLDLSKY